MAPSERNIANSVFMVYFFVDNKVLTYDDDTARTVSSGHLNQHVSCLVYREDMFADDMI